MQISDGKVVSIHYTLKNDAGNVLDSSNDREPLDYLHGKGNIIPGLEKALAGKSNGDELEVSIKPEEAYGVRDERLVEDVPRSAFKGVEDIQPGMQFQAQTPNGTQVITVNKINVADDTITVDGNHPLAGEQLNFKVEVVNVREATEEEKQHGHAHGAGGHKH